MCSMSMLVLFHHSNTRWMLRERKKKYSNFRKREKCEKLPNSLWTCTVLQCRSRDVYTLRVFIDVIVVHKICIDAGKHIKIKAKRNSITCQKCKHKKNHSRNIFRKQQHKNWSHWGALSKIFSCGISFYASRLAYMIRTAAIPAAAGWNSIFTGWEKKEIKSL